MRAVTLVRSLKIGIKGRLPSLAIVCRNLLSLISGKVDISLRRIHDTHLNDCKAPWLGRVGFSNLEHERKVGLVYGTKKLVLGDCAICESDDHTHPH